jgi:hypothetical protein
LYILIQEEEYANVLFELNFFDKNQDSERARDAFTIVNQAYNQLTDPELRQYCEDIVEDATRRMDLKNMNLRAQGFEVETNPDIIADQMMKTVFKIFAEREQRKKQKEKARQREDKRQREGEILLIQQMEDRKKEKELWESGTDQRIGNWKNWMKNTEKQKGKRETTYSKVDVPKPTNLQGPPPPPKGPPPVANANQDKLNRIRSQLNTGKTSSPHHDAPKGAPPPAPPPPSDDGRIRSKRKRSRSRSRSPRRRSKKSRY